MPDARPVRPTAAINCPWFDPVSGFDIQLGVVAVEGFHPAAMADNDMIAVAGRIIDRLGHRTGCRGINRRAVIAGDIHAGVSPVAIEAAADIAARPPAR